MSPAVRSSSEEKIGQSSAGPLMEAREAASGRYIWLLLIIGMILHSWLIVRWPIVFGGDTILRMANRDHILLSYQLPALQAALHWLAALSGSEVLARYLMAAIGSVAGVGFYLLATHFMDPGRAFLTGLLFASNPFILALSTVPYQEILMLAGLSFAFHFFFSSRFVMASLSLVVACLTRYEAWAACPVLVVAFAIERKWRSRDVVQAILMFGSAPLLWMLYRHGMSPGGTYVLDTHISALRLMRYVYLGWITVKNTPIPVLALVVIGLSRTLRTSAWKQRNSLVLISFLLIFLVSILFSAHGVSPDTERFVTAREAHLLITAAVMLAGLGLGLAQFPKVTWLLVVSGVGLGIYDAGRFVERETSPPNVRLSYDLARYLDSSLPDNTRVIVLVQPIPRELVQSYLDRVFEKGGTAALADAQRVLNSMDTSPPDCQRTLVHSRLERERFLCSGEVGTAQLDPSDGPRARKEWVAVWSDFTPSNAIESRVYESAVKGRTPAHILNSGPLSVSIYE